jgi:hypothetical protein
MNSTAEMRINNYHFQHFKNNLQLTCQKWKRKTYTITPIVMLFPLPAKASGRETKVKYPEFRSLYICLQRNSQVLF